MNVGGTAIPGRVRRPSLPLPTNLQDVGRVMKKRNIINQKYGRYLVLHGSHYNKQKQFYWVCLCDCGNIRSVRHDALISGHSKGCGCSYLKNCSIPGCNNKYMAKGYCNIHYMRIWRYNDVLHTERERHGMVDTSEYKTWQDMKERCYRINNDHYHRYGGRGIIVCDKWKNSFMAFFADMGLKPFPKAQIDRIDNDGNYEPENCRWVSQKENARSRKKLTMAKAEEIRNRYKLDNMTYAELGKIYRVSVSAIFNIIHKITYNEVMER